jgi:hypothetical protein
LARIVWIRDEAATYERDIALENLELDLARVLQVHERRAA